MEGRGDASALSHKRPEISRRSCDHCRTRKIACDRATPCSNCQNARLSCVHSAVTTKTRESRQRVLISSQYEQRLERISENLDEIKRLLLRPEDPSRTGIQTSGSTSTELSGWDITGSGKQPPCPFEGESSLTAHSLDASRFVEGIAATSSAHGGRENLLAYLRDILQRKNDQMSIYRMTFSADEHPSTACSSSENLLPRIESVIFILRWAQEHSSYYVTTWLSQILPLSKFTDICQKVFFAVNGYSEVEFILANSCLMWLFSEYAVISGQPKFRDYAIQCTKNVESALKRLPFLLPASMEVIAALVIGALHAIEVSKAVLAWTFISSASHLCQTLGYHQATFIKNDDQSVRMMKQRLFLTIYRIDKTLSLRLGRYSNIHEYALSLIPESTERRWNKTATILGQVYEQLYSSNGLSQPPGERIKHAQALAEEMQSLIDESRNSYETTISGPDNTSGDILRGFYLEAEQVIRLSALALIHRVIPAQSGAKYSFSEPCITASREALAAHQRSIDALQAFTNNPLELSRYINCVILHIPFVPFIILFRHAIEASDTSDLSRLATFTASMQSMASASRVYRLFEILYQVAQLQIEANPDFEASDQRILDDEFNDYMSIFDFSMPSGFDNFADSFAET
ncbi:hypothetical protein F5884DRAFT_781508 [Xylogone sp. PMI_703]|nr:hypothetical protein F5884DRAFT_781508 [Xylogone sp. PMI_703]